MRDIPDSMPLSILRLYRAQPFRGLYSTTGRNEVANMIELLNTYRAAKVESERAAREMGRAFGKAFEQDIRSIDEYHLPEFDELNEQPRIATINNKFHVRSVATEALRGFITQEHDRFFIGLNLNNRVLAKIPGSRIPLEEAPFMEGFMEGYNESRRTFQSVRNGKLATASSV